MSQNVIKVKRRGVGKRAVKDVRQAGLIPGVYYLKGQENIHFSVEPLAIREYVYTNKAKVMHLNFEDGVENTKCIVKDVRFDPVTDDISHLDLLGLQDGHKVIVYIPLLVTGRAEGVRAGGRLMQVLHKLQVHCLPKDLVEYVEVDVTNLKMGQSIKLKDLNLENLSFDMPENSIVVSVNKPRVGTLEEEEAEAEAAAAAAEEEE